MGPAVDDGCRFGSHFWRPASELSKTRVAVELNYFLCYIIDLYKPCLSALGQPLWMAAHASGWGESLNRRHRGGKRNTMVMMFVGRVVLMLDGFLVLFLL